MTKTSQTSNHNDYASRSDLFIAVGANRPKVDYLLESCKKVMGLHAVVIPLPQETDRLNPDWINSYGEVPQQETSA